METKKMICVHFIIPCVIILFFKAAPVLCRSISEHNTSIDATNQHQCLKAPEAVLINCIIWNVSSFECIDLNVISVPSLQGESDAISNNILINCTAPYPIDIKITGFQLTDTTYKTYFVRNADNVFNEATFVYSIGIVANAFRAPRRIVVTKITDPSHQMDFFIFRPSSSDDGLLSIPTNHTQSHLNTIIEINPEKTIIPCISSDPHLIPELNKITADGKNQPLVPDKESVKYDKTQGFTVYSKNITNPDGLYTCINNYIKNNSSRRKTIIFEIIPRKDFVAEPNLSHIILFKNDMLHLTCRNKRKIQLIGTFKGESIVGQTTVDTDFTSTFIHRKVKVGDVGKIDCVEEDGNTKIHSWTIETLDIYNNPKLKLTKVDNNEVACISTFSDVRIQTVFCQGVSNCELNRNCFNQGKKCPDFQDGYPCKNASLGGSSCLNFTEHKHFTQGMIKCLAGNYSYTTKYFRGFDKVLYLDWETAPIHALIEVRVPTNITMYPHNSYPFGCRASRFISDGKIQWVIRGKDGSEILLHKKRVQDINSTYNLDYDLYTVRESNIRLIYPNDYDVLCMVPMWNATGSLRNYKLINVADKKAPVTEIVVIAVVVIILLIIPLVYVIWRLKKAKDAIRNLTEQEVEDFIKGNPEALQQVSKDKEAHEVVNNIPYNKDAFEIPRDKLLIDTENILGEGAFGTVLKGKVDGISDIVAVKTVKQRCDVDQFKAFLSELKIMMYIGKHPFVVTLIGAYTEKIREKIIYIVVEYCYHGSLESFLRKRKGWFFNQIKEDEICLEDDEKNTYANVPHSDSNSDSKGYENMSKIKTVDLVRWSYEIATGMAYLASIKVVHADLAARNVLLHQNGHAKITDFGLSRQLFDYKPYVKKQEEPMPWRSMAIEALQSLSFSTQSDIWAYGVTIWEVFSLGDIPYPGLSWTISFVDDLVNGLRITKPTYSTSAIYNIMLNCWRMDPQLRPTFQFLSDYFRNILVSLNIDVENVTVPSFLMTPIHNKPNWKRASDNLYMNSTVS